MRFFTVFAVFCTFLSYAAVFSVSPAFAQFSFGQKKHKYWWEEGYEQPSEAVPAPMEKMPVEAAPMVPAQPMEVMPVEPVEPSAPAWTGRQSDNRKNFNAHWRDVKKFFFGWGGHDDARPHSETAKGLLNNQYEGDQWSPKIWTENRGSAQGVIDDFYGAGLITDQYVHEGRAVLEVGQPFLDLSFQDKLRVAQYVDHVYGVTAGGCGFDIIFDNWYDTRVGTYSQSGLQLQ